MVILYTTPLYLSKNYTLKFSYVLKIHFVENQQLSKVIQNLLK